MNGRCGALAIVVLAAALGSAAWGQQEDAMQPKHVTVYFESGRFGGWPANHGIWIWGNEILVGFSRGYYKDLGPERHNIDREKPEEHALARSLDGGETWTVEHPNEHGFLLPQGESLHGVELPGVAIPELKECPGSIEFTHPDFAMTLRMSSVDAGVSRFYYSYDRGHVWEGPFRLPNFDTPGVAARTDYLIDGPSACTLFLTAAKQNREEGRPFCARTTDGGKTWNFLSWIMPEPKGFGIMPASVRLSPTDLVTTIRRREPERQWLETYASHDDGKTWTFLNDAVAELGEGNPSSLIRLRDGRLCLTYGYRAKPFGIRARLSGDGGQSWGPEVHLRDDGAGRDIGYCRSVQRPDGRVVTVYYFHDAVTGPERYIGATIWNPGE